jgi:glycosyltransferase
MASTDGCISIIVPSYNDARVIDAISSVRRFDDIGIARIVLIDGGSRPDLVERIAAALRPDDILVSEPDRGIFDALNKGLAASPNEFIGWIGSDDVFSGSVSASMVRDGLRDADLFVAHTAHVDGDAVTRLTYSWSSGHRLTHRVLNNPHFSTFGRAALLKSETFPLDLRGADIAYFLRVFDRGPRVRTVARVATFMQIGGYSNRNMGTSLRMHGELMRIHRQYMPAPLAIACVALKLGFKALTSLYYALRAENRAALLARYAARN